MFFKRSFPLRHTSSLGSAGSGLQAVLLSCSLHLLKAECGRKGRLLWLPALL